MPRVLDASGFIPQDGMRFKAEDIRRMAKREIDPHGIDQHLPGAKLDSGKLEVSLVFEGFPRALLEVARVATYGANKYTRNGWMEVPDGEYRYKNAAGRHKLNRLLEGECDQESGLLHEAHELWNYLAALELKLRRIETDGV